MTYNEIVDKYANKNGYKNWSDMVKDYHFEDTNWIEILVYNLSLFIQVEQLKVTAENTSLEMDSEFNLKVNKESIINPINMFL